MHRRDTGRWVRRGTALLVVAAASVGLGALLAGPSDHRAPSPTTGAAGDVTILTTPPSTVTAGPATGPREVSHTQPGPRHRPNARS